MLDKKCLKGFTLIEVMATLLISTIALGGISVLLTLSIKEWKESQEIIELQQQLHLASYSLNRAIRSATDIDVTQSKNDITIYNRTENWEKRFYQHNTSLQLEENATVDTVIDSLKTLSFTPYTNHVKVEMSDEKYGENLETSFSVYMKNKKVVGIYHFDEGTGNDTVVDSSSYTNNGTIHGADWSNDGFKGKCLSFDGNHDYVKIPDNNSLDFNSDFLVMEAAIYPDSTSGTRTIIEKDNSYKLFLNGGTLKWAIFTQDNNWVELNTGEDISSGTWSHILVTYQWGTMKAWVNGNLVFESEINKNIKASSAPLGIGGEGDNGSNSFNGEIDEVYIAE